MSDVVEIARLREHIIGLERLLDRYRESAEAHEDQRFQLAQENAAMREIVQELFVENHEIGKCEVKLIPFPTLAKARVLLEKAGE